MSGVRHCEHAKLLASKISPYEFKLQSCSCCLTYHAEGGRLDQRNKLIATRVYLFECVTQDQISKAKPFYICSLRYLIIPINYMPV